MEDDPIEEDEDNEPLENILRENERELTKIMTAMRYHIEILKRLKREKDIYTTHICSLKHTIYTKPNMTSIKNMTKSDSEDEYQPTQQCTKRSKQML